MEESIYNDEVAISAIEAVMLDEVDESVLARLDSAEAMVYDVRRKLALMKITQPSTSITVAIRAVLRERIRLIKEENEEGHRALAYQDYRFFMTQLGIHDQLSFDEFIKNISDNPSWMSAYDRFEYIMRNGLVIGAIVTHTGFEQPNTYRIKSITKSCCLELVNSDTGNGITVRGLYRIVLLKNATKNSMVIQVLQLDDDDIEASFDQLLVDRGIADSLGVSRRLIAQGAIQELGEDARVVGLDESSYREGTHLYRVGKDKYFKTVRSSNAKGAEMAFDNEE